MYSIGCVKSQATDYKARSYLTAISPKLEICASKIYNIPPLFLDIQLHTKRFVFDGFVSIVLFIVVLMI